MVLWYYRNSRDRIPTARLNVLKVFLAPFIGIEALRAVLSLTLTTNWFVRFNDWCDNFFAGKKPNQKKALLKIITWKMLW